MLYPGASESIIYIIICVIILLISDLVTKINKQIITILVLRCIYYHT